MIKKNYLGQEIVFDLCPSQKGSFPIGRFNGIVVKVNIPERLGYIHVGSTVKGVVIEQKDKVLIVDVKYVVCSHIVNEYKRDKLLRSIKTVKKERVKTVKSYPYLSDVEKRKIIKNTTNE